MTVRCRRFHGEPVQRIIATVPAAMLAEVYRIIGRPTEHDAGCLAEFVRVAIAEKVGCDLMLSRPERTKAQGSVKR